MRTQILRAARWAFRTKEQIISWLAERNYHSARAYYMYRLRRTSRRSKREPVVVYQMGKVGSMTIASSLSALGKGIPCYHVHFLSQNLIDKYLQERREFFGTEKYGRLKHIWLYEYLRKQLDGGLGGRKWKVVTLTREPISRNISTFFENLQVEPLDDGRQYRVSSDHDFYDFEIVVDIEDLRGLVRLFLERLEHDEPLRYFDQEMKGVLDIDVFSSEFPVSKGYKIYEAEKADLLLIRLEDLNACASIAFKEFLNIEGFALVDRNVGGDKVYASLYKRFRDSIVLPEAYIERMYTSRYMRHFYSEQEIAAFRSKWISSVQR